MAEHPKASPFTGEDFVEILVPLTNRTTGVYSSSGKEPLKQANFPERYKAFEREKRYSDGRFIYVPPQGQIPPGQLTIPEQQPLVSPTEPRRLPR